MRSYTYALFYWGVTTTIAPVFIREETKNFAFIFGVAWGLGEIILFIAIFLLVFVTNPVFSPSGFGWLFPTQRTVYSMMIPAGQETELMGLYIFSGQVIVWVPPLVFSVLNQLGAGMAWGMASDGLLFLMAAGVCKFKMMPVFDQVVTKAKSTHHLRVMSKTAGQAAMVPAETETELTEVYAAVSQEEVTLEVVPRSADEATHVNPI